MKKFPASKAKNQFGKLLDTAQSEPVTIERQGRPVAVVVSMDTYKASEALKLEALDRDLQVGIDELDAGKGIDADEVFNMLESDLEKE